ncbi:hypothetical protein [Dyadobacter sediminis]|uniref:Outer membrane protein beta-barrel domain-containing protein n=1 Tax=Dyadobacter sediminis TaxID=1493691 RepID=A0A5R9KEA8_9BACT|nr:hypothetical protein [Dyadobacter sediminis]TLU94462.1 hypothetical protein FEM55_09490 [Dyadobacter sediminis]GGB91025.1 hypothetical protein GCM10011325_18080 [Dyadobacter sediminis]
MKTSKFENTIRQKLESIEPDFQEQDWAKMQRYMQAHTPPTFWQQYSSWIGYAAAASITTVMAFLYINQLSKNNHLTADVKSLKNQIEVIKSTTLPAAKTDTIYIVRKEHTERANEPLSSENRNAYQTVKRGPERYNVEIKNFEATDEIAGKIDHTVKDHTIVKNRQPFENLRSIEKTPNNTDFNPARSGEIVAYGNPESIAEQRNPGFDIKSDAGREIKTRLAENQRILNTEFSLDNIEIAALSNKENPVPRKMNYNLASRISARQVNKSLLAVSASVPKTLVAVKNAEKTNKTENVIPELNLKVPYRFGGGVQVESNGTSKAILGEVLVSRKFSVSAGISWLKVKPMEFFTEKMFRDKNRKDFKRSHPDEVPLALEVFNIKVSPTLVQIPLTVAFRNTVKNDWSYYGSAGTNIRVSSKESISFACRAPNNEYLNQSFDRKTDMPAVSSMNVALGIEKMWHPIVVQAEGYLYTYFKPLTPLSHNAGPGVKVKLMYQIGGKM